MSATVEVAANVEVSHVRSHKEPLAQASRCGLGYRVESWLVDLSVDSCRGKSLCRCRDSIFWLGVLRARTLLPLWLLRVPGLCISRGLFHRRHIRPAPSLLPSSLAMTSLRKIASVKAARPRAGRFVYFKNSATLSLVTRSTPV